MQSRQLSTRTCVQTPHAYKPARQSTMPPTITQAAEAAASSTSDDPNNLTKVIKALLSTNNDISLAALIVSIIVGILTALDVYFRWDHLQWERQPEPRAAANAQSSCLSMLIDSHAAVVLTLTQMVSEILLMQRPTRCNPSTTNQMTKPLLGSIRTIHLRTTSTIAKQYPCL